MNGDRLVELLKSNDVTSIFYYGRNTLYFDGGAWWVRGGNNRAKKNIVLYCGASLKDAIEALVTA